MECKKESLFSDLFRTVARYTRLLCVIFKNAERPAKQFLNVRSVHTLSTCVAMETFLVLIHRMGGEGVCECFTNTQVFTCEINDRKKQISSFCNMFLFSSFNYQSTNQEKSGCQDALKVSRLPLFVVSFMAMSYRGKDLSQCKKVNDCFCLELCMFYFVVYRG